MKQIIGYFLIFLSILLMIYIIFLNTMPGNVTRTFSTYTFLVSTWDKFRDQFINKDGRVIDYSQNSITTSEGQSYAMLRSVWVDDKPTFDKVWTWTKNTMKRPQDNLMGWRWGKKDDGSYGFLTGGGDNSASDADSDIALSLILASRRWGDKNYLSDAKKILDSLWLFDTGSAAGSRYLIAGNWANENGKLVINPSYFSPAAFRIFATVDTSHDWQSMVSPGYDLLNKVGSEPLDKARGAGIPPDWISLDVTTGVVTHADIPSATTNYSYDAIRVPFRVALDYQWNKDKRAYVYLTNSFKILDSYYKEKKMLASVYSHDGSALNSQESPSMYATSLAFLIYADKASADRIYQEKILKLYSNNTNSFNSDIGYYDQNWLWFGSALYNNYLSHF